MYSCCVVVYLCFGSCLILSEFVVRVLVFSLLLCTQVRLPALVRSSGLVAGRGTVKPVLSTPVSTQTTIVSNM